MAILLNVGHGFNIFIPNSYLFLWEYLLVASEENNWNILPGCLPEANTQKIYYKEATIGYSYK